MTAFIKIAFASFTLLGASFSAAAQSPPVKPPTKLHSPAIAKQIKVAASAPAATASSASAAAVDPLAADVLTGSIKCELGRVVVVAANPKKRGHFNVSVGKVSFDMKPVETTTGALRMEDKARGGVWLQLGNKSMLMNEKIGQRVADNCIHPQQVIWIAEAKARPPGPSLFGDAPAAPASAAASAPAAAAVAASAAASAPR